MFDVRCSMFEILVSNLWIHVSETNIYYFLTGSGMRQVAWSCSTWRRRRSGFSQNDRRGQSSGLLGQWAPIHTNGWSPVGRHDGGFTKTSTLGGKSTGKRALGDMTLEGIADWFSNAIEDVHQAKMRCWTSATCVLWKHTSTVWPSNATPEPNLWYRMALLAVHPPKTVNRKPKITKQGKYNIPIYNLSKL